MECIIDARGLNCPLPVIQTKNKIAEMKNGGVIRTIVDNKIAVQNLTKYAEYKGLEAVSRKKSDQEYEVVIMVPEMETEADDETASETETDAKTETKMNTDTKTKNDESVSCEPCRETNAKKRGELVVISSNQMGAGEAELGTALMKAFLFSLTKQDQFPETILLYNSGAFLSCEGSDSLEDLRFLESEGVEILTCGTCLNYYQLEEKRRVGFVTNMYDIVERMQKAAKIIKP